MDAAQALRSDAQLLTRLAKEIGALRRDADTLETSLRTVSGSRPVDEATAEAAALEQQMYRVLGARARGKGGGRTIERALVCVGVNPDCIAVGFVCDTVDVRRDGCRNAIAAQIKEKQEQLRAHETAVTSTERSLNRVREQRRQEEDKGRAREAAQKQLRELTEASAALEQEIAVCERVWMIARVGSSVWLRVFFFCNGSSLFGRTTVAIVLLRAEMCVLRLSGIAGNSSVVCPAQDPHRGTRAGPGPCD